MTAPSSRSARIRPTPATTAADTDTDGDGVNDGNEMFYGTDPTKADTDGDSTGTTSLNDGEELYGTRTDPTKADTDGDGATDGDEIDAATDPLDPTDTPAFAARQPERAAISNQALPRATLDANGKIHVITTATSNGGLYYYMLDPTGSRDPADGDQAAEVLAGTSNLRRPVIAAAGGKIFVTYELLDNSLAPRASASSGSTRRPRRKTARPSDVVADRRDQHQRQFVGRQPAPPRHAGRRRRRAPVYMLYPSKSARSSSVNFGFAYARLSLDGVVQTSRIFPLPTRTQGGMHHWTRPLLVLGGDGKPNVFLLASGNRRRTGSVVWVQLGTPTPTIPTIYRCRR